MSLKAAGKPLPLLEFFDIESEDQTAPTPGTQKPVTIQSSTNPLVVVSPTEMQQGSPHIATVHSVLS